MIRTSAFVTAAVIGAVVFTSTTPAQAADQGAIKRAIVVTVLNNLGVQPTDQLVNQIVGDIPMNFLDSTLVREVGTALDNSEDPTLIISQTIDSDGDGIPNADATVDSDDESDDDADDADDDSSGSSGSSGDDSGSSGSDDDANDEDDEDDEDDEEDGDDGDDGDN
ncbi:MAG: hypothetical protein RL294_260 [Actinomycetota bacterium]